jgi:uncharacterized protein (DUF433 family)
MKVIHEGWITRTKEVMMGKPCIKGTRVTVELILQRLSEGETIESLLEGYPHITKEGILACIDYPFSIIRNHENKNKIAQ